MSDRSFEKFDYALRPNKNVERKMFFRSLKELEAAFGISAYRYAGLGSLWFVDFMLAHRELGISDMATMEREHSRAKRVEFNRPLACIKVHMEAAVDAMPKIIDEKKLILWLDYDGAVSAALSGDLEIALGKMAPGSFLLVTVNGELGQLDRLDEEKVQIARGQTLAEITGDAGWTERENDLNRRDFPKIVASILLDRMRSIVLSYRPGLEFTPIWNFRYADDATMVTVGGMIGDESNRLLLSRSGIFERLEYISGEQPYEIDLPVLTVREKREFDRNLPCEFSVDVRKLPFELRPSEAAAYQKYYGFYPIYDEIAL
jgi:hypothetical protein